MLGVKYACAVTSGTTALYVGLKALGIDRGDEVIVPDLTFVAGPNSVEAIGAKPILVDIEQDSLNLDLKKIKQDGYYISTQEFALMLNISTEALRSRRRRGELKGQYKFDGKKYWWQGLRPGTVKKIKNNRHVVRDSRPNIKRKRRRGVHIRGEETLYQNHAFKIANELKMLNRIKSEVPESVINEINPELIKLAQDKLLKKREQIDKKNL